MFSSIIRRTRFSFIRNYSASGSSKEPISATSTIDNVEISHFKTYSEDWWNENGKVKTLHAMNKLRVPLVRDGIIYTAKIPLEIVRSPKPLKNIKILDVGCGGGVLTEALARLGADITGLDACKELIDCAHLHAKNDPEIADNINYIHGSIEEHCSAENLNKYDSVVASEIIEHVTSHKLFIESCTGVLKPGGSIFLTTLNKTLISWFGGIIVAENILGLVEKNLHEWNKFIPPHELQKLLEDNNCRTKCIHGMTYNFLCNEWYWFPSDSINYALHAVKHE